MAIKVDIFAHNMELVDQLKDYIDKKASKLDRYLSEIEHVKVDLDHVKSVRSATDRYIAQLTVRGRRALLRTEVRADEIIPAFDSAIDKMQRQMERYKGKHYRGRGDGRPAGEAPELVQEESGETTSVISRRKKFDLLPISEADALEQMELLGHDNFFLFFNIETGTINVLYHRRDGTYGLIQPEIR
ncbi:MAG: ribosome-associated translation inhibitor RaiA [Chloroflexota bacterium]